MSKKLFAGRIPNTSTVVTSIYEGPSDAPLTDYVNNIDKLYFDTRLDYMHLVATVNVSVSFAFQQVTQDCGKKGKDCSAIPRSGTVWHTLGTHNRAYTPTILLFDTDNNRALSGTMFIQNISNNSFRLCAVYVDNTSIYLRERWFVRYNALSSITRNFKVYVFNKPAT